MYRRALATAGAAKMPNHTRPRLPRLLVGLAASPCGHVVLQEEEEEEEGVG